MTRASPGSPVASTGKRANWSRSADRRRSHRDRRQQGQTLVEVPGGRGLARDEIRPGRLQDRPFEAGERTPQLLIGPPIDPASHRAQERVQRERYRTHRGPRHRGSDGKAPRRHPGRTCRAAGLREPQDPPPRARGVWRTGRERRLLRMNRSTGRAAATPASGRAGTCRGSRREEGLPISRTAGGFPVMARAAFEHRKTTASATASRST